MKILKTGSYLGAAKKTLNVNGLIVSDTEYRNKTHFPTHCHENPYFAFVLKGGYDETNKHDKSRHTTGNVVFHNRHEKHSNENFTPYSRILNLELTEKWLKYHDINPGEVENISAINEKNIEPFASKLLFESIYSDHYSELSIDALAVEILEGLLSSSNTSVNNSPAWASKIKEYLSDNDDVKISLTDLSMHTGMHSVHISRAFSKYFKMSFGDYIRKQKVQRSLALLRRKDFSITQIAHDSGFADQSHYTRIFKRFKGITPARYRTMIMISN
ncbi:MAG: helix-turn-helix transcriptional regulator [Ignavibacteria bacterium]|nr:helix-turn-helix transcriptional regulator [Ignavibacteria bacterium]